MSEKSAASQLKRVQQREMTKIQQEAMAHPELFVQIAAHQGYYISPEAVTDQIQHMSLEELASVVNPGVAPRRHLIPR
jgi:endonuclease IV